MPPGLELTDRIPRRYDRGPSDIFCLVKQNMCDDALMQPPLLVWPGDEHEKVQTFWQQMLDHKGVRADVDAERAQDLLELGEALAAYPQYQRACEYIEGLAGKRFRARHVAHHIGFIAAATRPVNQAGPLALPSRPERSDPHRLQVRFHYK